MVEKLYNFLHHNKLYTTRHLIIELEYCVTGTGTWKGQKEIEEEDEEEDNEEGEEEEEEEDKEKTRQKNEKEMKGMRNEQND